MTPLINGIDRLSKYFKVADDLKVARATDELRDPGDDERREKLIDYVDSAFNHVKETCVEAGDEVRIISRQARQVEAILTDQERHAYVAPVAEDLGLDEVIDEAVLVIPKTESPEVEVDREATIARLRVRAHRVGLLQVLGNLILNAYESIQRSDSDRGKIRLSAKPETVENTRMIRVTISDTGCGFDQQDSRKIFQRGFSSKGGTTSGLGLHWCANALGTMGGKIKAESTGPGRGAEFHILLPAA
jgi:C4-dicarboxylate-specific signal transduction histidine kinase